jgi:hypothetical protein
LTLVGGDQVTTQAPAPRDLSPVVHVGGNARHAVDDRGGHQKRKYW